MRVAGSEAIHCAASGDVDCFVAEPVIGPAQEGRTRWLLAMTGYFPVTPPPLRPTTTPAFFSTVFIAEVKSDSGP